MGRGGEKGGSRVSRGPHGCRGEEEGVAILYEQASHKLSRLFKKLEKGASASRVEQLAPRE